MVTEIYDISLLSHVRLYWRHGKFSDVPQHQQPNPVLYFLLKRKYFINDLNLSSESGILFVALSGIQGLEGEIIKFKVTVGTILHDPITLCSLAIIFLAQRKTPFSYFKNLVIFAG